MRVGFAGTPDFAARALVAVHASGHTIPIVLTQPDRPSGRGMTLQTSPVKRYALAHGLPVGQPTSLRDADARAALLGIPLDVLVVAAYGLILPRAVLDWPRHGCLNVHASLLPRWRGAAPIARAIEAGDAATGITIMQMDAGLDTGPIVTQDTLDIDARETAGTLHDRLAELGAQMIVAALAALERDGALASRPQPETGATYAAKLERAERPLDWTAPAVTLDRKVRALSPAPGVTATWRETPFIVRSAEPLADAERPGSASKRSGRPPAATGEPGTVTAVASGGIDVCCGDGTRLRLLAVQPAGGRAMPAGAFAAGRGIVPGARFEPAAGPAPASSRR
jgi:methionyl-tRNA formyltransferase